MKIDSIRKKVREDGFFETAVYYFCRVWTKSEMHLIGKWIRKFGTVNEKRIVFKNRQMQDFTDNARALFEYLIEKGYNQEYQIIWAVSEKNKLKQKKYKNVIFVTAENRHGWTSARAFYYGNTAKYFFYTNNTADLTRYHCKGQITVNLWHGCGYKGAIRNNTEIPQSHTMEMFDYVLVPGPVFVQTKSLYWGCDKSKILPLGYPRYDWMLDKSNDRSRMLEKLFQWKDTGGKVVIWMPTFRKSSLTGYAENTIELPYDLPGVDSSADLADINQFCMESNLLLIIKKHPLQTRWKETHIFSNICYVSDEMLRKNEVQLYGLVGVCDALISDYSSIAIDYLLLNRPIGFVLADYDDYAKTRGFVFEDPLKYMPGEKIYNSEDIKKFLKHVSSNEDVWKKAREDLLPEMHNVTPDYCKRIAEQIFK